MPRHTETELKLAVAPDQLDGVGEAPVVIARRTGAPVTKMLESHYYDTVDRRLLARRAALRVRLTPDGYIQTLKSGGGLVRGEWEWPVSGPVVDLTVITEPAAREFVAGIASESLVLVFVTRFIRTIHLIDQGAIELAVDQGEIVSPAGSGEPISEVELELKSGWPVDLYRLALALAETVALRVEQRSKAERGFALTDRAQPAPVKASRLALLPTTTVDSAMSAIFGACFTQLTANESCIMAGVDPEGVHQARVALRRFRSALSLFRTLLPPTDYQWLNAETKWLAAVLGPAREWDVFLEELLAPVKVFFAVHPGVYDDLVMLENAVSDQRSIAYEAVREALLSPRYTMLQLCFGEWLEGWGWRAQPVTLDSARLFHPLRKTAVNFLASRHRKSLKSGADFAKLYYSERHRVRIALKRLRYTVDFFRALHDDKSVTRYLRLLGALQDTLGQLNDVATAMQMISHLATAELPELPELSERPGQPESALMRALGIVIGWHGRALAEREPQLVAEWRAFINTKPFWRKAAGLSH
ncbi:MAG: CYTH and CHAD domain-containing protein [Rhodospirillaceae bacterium]